MGRPPRFDAPCRLRGFTPIPPRELQLLGLLSLAFLRPIVVSLSFRLALRLVSMFPPSLWLLWPLLTPRSEFPRGPFGPNARTPQVRHTAFPPQPPDLRRLPLVARASRSLARSPWLAPPLSGSCSSAWTFRYPLLSAGASRHCPPCGSLGVPVTKFPRGLTPPGRVSCWAHQKRPVSNKETGLTFEYGTKKCGA
jgi:hypothetical protein